MCYTGNQDARPGGVWLAVGSLHSCLDLIWQHLMLLFCQGEVFFSEYTDGFVKSDFSLRSRLWPSKSLCLFLHPRNLECSVTLVMLISHVINKPTVFFPFFIENWFQPQMSRPIFHASKIKTPTPSLLSNSGYEKLMRASFCYSRVKELFKTVWCSKDDIVNPLHNRF